MATFGVQVTGVEKVLQRMKDLPGKLDEAEKRAVLRGQVQMTRKWKENVSGPILKVRTTAYRSSIQPAPIDKTAQGYEGRVGIIRGKAEKYAPVHEFGATIRPKASNVRGRLAFRIPGVGWRSATSVTIPARRPMGRSFDEIRPVLLEQFAASVKRVVDSAR